MWLRIYRNKHPTDSRSHAHFSRAKNWKMLRFQYLGLFVIRKNGPCIVSKNNFYYYFHVKVVVHRRSGSHGPLGASMKVFVEQLLVGKMFEHPTPPWHWRFDYFISNDNEPIPRASVHVTYTHRHKYNRRCVNESQCPWGRILLQLFSAAIANGCIAGP